MFMLTFCHEDFSSPLVALPGRALCLCPKACVPAHIPQAMYCPLTPQTCHPLTVQQMPSDSLSSPAHLTSPPTHTPVAISFISPAVT